MYLMTPIFQVILNYKDSRAELQWMEWEVFSNQLKKEIRQSTKGEINSGHLVLTRDTETITYEQYGTVIRRRVNSTGNEITLQNVSQYTFVIVNNAVKLTVKDLSGKVYSLTAYPLVAWKPIT